MFYSAEAPGECVFRYSCGESPVHLRNSREKCCWLEIPTSMAISSRLLPVPVRSSFACWMPDALQVFIHGFVRMLPEKPVQIGGLNMKLMGDDGGCKGLGIVRRMMASASVT